jgi:hypothetical protein
MAINTYAEKTLHAQLKRWLARDEDRLEHPYADHIIDVLRDADSATPTCIEVQTRSLRPLKAKLMHLLAQPCRVQLVYPIAQARTVVRVAADDTPISRRTSPKRGALTDIFPQLVSYPALLPRVHLQVLMICEEEIWRDDGRGSWRRKHWSIADRRLLEVVSTHDFTSAADYAALLPAPLPSAFTVAQIAAHIGGRQAQAVAGKMAFVLYSLGVLARVGKHGRAWLYERT